MKKLIKELIALVLLYGVYYVIKSQSDQLIKEFEMMPAMIMTFCFFVLVGIAIGFIFQDEKIRFHFQFQYLIVMIVSFILIYIIGFSSLALYFINLTGFNNILCIFAGINLYLALFE